MAQNKAQRKPPAVHIHAVDFSDINWSSQPVVLRHRHGGNIRLSDNNSVAERVNPSRDFRKGVVMTAEPVPVGGVFQVTVLEEVNKWSGGLVSVVNQKQSWSLVVCNLFYV